MLETYITQTQRLLQNPAPATGLYSRTSLIDYINTARKQLAGEAACIRAIGTLNTVVGQRAYGFGSMTLQNTTGIAGIFNIRRISVVMGDLAAGSQLTLTSRPWEWFDQYYVNKGVLETGVPSVWAQYAQGGQAPTAGPQQSGSFFVDPVPDAVYALYSDCACYPTTLVDDTTPEAIPYIFTDAVPFFAAWYALLSNQTQARRADAEAYYSYYQTFLGRAQKIATPAVLGHQYEQASDPVTGGQQ